jgi:phage shock protein PspC (stress-responsive transcriptional regulator)
MTTTETGEGPQPRRFVRARRGRLIGGVCSGLGSYFGIDPLLFRIAFVAVSFFGGAGLFVYAALILFVPEEGASRAPIRALARHWPTILGAVALIAGASLAIDAVAHSLDEDGGAAAGLGVVAVIGAAAAALWWRLRGGEESPSADRRMWRRIALWTAMGALGVLLFAAGGLLAGLEGGLAGWAVVAAGAVLVVATFAGRGRWLIFPAVAFALPVTLVTAADADLHGGVGDRIHRPASIDELRDRYRLGVGRLEVDLRDVRFPAGDTPLRLRVGVGEAVLLVPEDVCVQLESRVGGGYVGALDRDHGGLDEEWSNDPATPPSGTPRLVVDGEVGMGALFVADRPFEGDHGHRGSFEPGRFGTNDACRRGTEEADR